jgi:hypothetical protein
MGVAAAQRASIYEQELCLYAKRAQLRCQGSSLATANRAKLLKIPDVDYAIVMERLSHELRLRWDAAAQEVQRLTPREWFHPLVAKFAVPMFEKQLKPSTAKNSRTLVTFPPPEEHRTFCEKQKPLKTQNSSRKGKQHGIRP